MTLVSSQRYRWSGFWFWSHLGHMLILYLSFIGLSLWSGGHSYCPDYIGVASISNYVTVVLPKLYSANLWQITFSEDGCVASPIPCDFSPVPLGSPCPWIWISLWLLQPLQCGRCDAMRLPGLGHGKQCRFRLLCFLDHSHGSLALPCRKSSYPEAVMFWWCIDHIKRPGVGPNDYNPCPPPAILVFSAEAQTSWSRDKLCSVYPVPILDP